MRSQLISLSLIVVFSLVSCSSMKFQIASEPDAASVYLKKGSSLKKLGETPLNLSARDFNEAGPYNLLIEKEGFQSEQILIEERTLAANAEIHATLKKLEGSTDRQVASVAGADGAGHRAVASIQTQLLQKNFSQAEVLSREFVNQNPFSAVGWNLLGNSILLQNRNAEALDAYRRALEYDPENQDTLKMIRYLDNQPAKRER